MRADSSNNMTSSLDPSIELRITVYCTTCLFYIFQIAKLPQFLKKKVSCNDFISLWCTLMKGEIVFNLMIEKKMMKVM